MPSVLRQSGPKHVKDGQEITPRAMVHFCETCGVEGAMFGMTGADGKRLWFCGYENGTPMCVKRGEK